ncbi:FHA domain-containing protein [Variovorax saccharolyticus]|uniref:FHA domain-containing protein n=1 Tax=Variovorax saccharolyticus TaxID=3053516 RepID=UPI002575F6B3|nr:FHA domain-containing protein [Variovorax sp. J31P216]MDM0029581.1 FHA domain-containing protein [Variovorax sp. J31P216]
MQSSIYAFCLSVIPAVAIFLLLTSGGMVEAQASAIAGLIIAAFPKILESIEKRTTKQSDNPSETIASLRTFEVSRNRAIVYSTAMGFAALNCSMVAAVYLIAAAANKKELVPIVAFNILICFLTAVSLFLVGRWVGRRCPAHGLPVIVASALLIFLLTGVLYRVLIGSVDVKEFASPSSQKAMIQFLPIGMISVFLIMLSGLFLGKRQHLSSYLSYLLKQLSTESRLYVVNVAYKETRDQSTMETQKRQQLAAHAAHVVGTAGPYLGSTFPLQSDLVFGRDPKTCNVVFRSDQNGISGSHCSLRFNPSTRVFELRDLNSANGTFVKGHRVRPNETRRLRDGDEFHLHTPACRFVVRSGAGLPKSAGRN